MTSTTTDVRLCPGASVAQVAMSYGLNANLVHTWRRLVADDGEVRSGPAFVRTCSDDLPRHLYIVTSAAGRLGY